MGYTKALLLLVFVGLAIATEESASVPEELQDAEENLVSIVEGCAITCNNRGYRNHPSDCHKFLQCTPYGQQEMACPEGTLWDQKQLRCEHEDAVPCRVGYFKTLSGESCPGHCQFDCPRAYGNFPHPRDCRRFFKCKNGVALYRTCGNGKSFDAETATCIDANVATCNASPDADC